VVGALGGRAELRRAAAAAAHRHHDEHYAPNLPCEADAVVLQARPVFPTVTFRMRGPLQRKQRGQGRADAAKVASLGWCSVRRAPGAGS